jgi:hypothetical protein
MQLVPLTARLLLRLAAFAALDLVEALDVPPKCAAALLAGLALSPRYCYASKHGCQNTVQFMTASMFHPCNQSDTLRSAQPCAVKRFPEPPWGVALSAVDRKGEEAMRQSARAWEPSLEPWIALLCDAEVGAPVHVDSP